MTARIISEYMQEDDRGTGSMCAPLLQLAHRRGLVLKTLEIQSLESGWEEIPGHFKSGAGPIFALKRATELIDDGVDLVRIHGKDELRHYSSEELQQRMQVFPGITLPDAYTELAKSFMAQRKISTEAFAHLSYLLEANYLDTAKKRGISAEPSHEPVTELFRMVDCANPRIDFEAEILVASSHACELLGCSGPEVAQVEIVEIEDGPKNVREIASYKHLAQLMRCLNLSQKERADLILEAYTCYPPVPLALVEALTESSDPRIWKTFIQQHPLTQSGGMNFSRAPWNNPALRGLVLVSRALRSTSTLGLVHGNGGLGGRQGLALLRTR